ncbi:RICIN domain-containing protein [Streptomyces sp. NPDC052236]|uniref:RICIN domain-containing protein n=1 Tax=Streptomyces sp. NPDC052236 TaxID=3365686 RepID=UPI0037CDBA2F
MQNPHTMPPVPSFPPARTAFGSSGSDEGLATTLRTSGGTDEAHPVAVLLARHWQPVFDYAAICTPTTKAAAMLSTAAFGKVLENLKKVGTAEAIRPLLLLTCRQIAKGWAADQRITALPELQYPDGGRTVRPDMFSLPENRQLVFRAFQALPGAAQCLLWHVEVEAEGISIPASLLAIDPRLASAQLQQARELLRTGCLRAHVELAPDEDCRHYSRLLDVSLRRGGTLIPDIQRHLAECQHCRHAAEQLNHLDGRLPVLLAEGVLGQAARAYIESRPARNRARTQTGAGQGGTGHGGTGHGGGGEPGGGGHEGGTRATGRHSKGGRARALPRMNLPARMTNIQGRRVALARPGVVLTGLGVLVTGALVVTAVSELWSDDADYAGPPVPSGAVTATTAPPAPGSLAPSEASPEPSATSAALPTGPLDARMRNADSGLCLDIRDGRAVLGAEVMMDSCDTSVTQQWSYEDDGLLRSSAAADLCLNSHDLDGMAELNECTPSSAADGADVRYDMTIQGNVIPRWNDKLALVPTSSDVGSAVVVKVRDGSEAQRWAMDNVAAVSSGDRPPAAEGTAPNTKEVNASPQAGRDSDPSTGKPVGIGNGAGNGAGNGIGNGVGNGIGQGVGNEGTSDVPRPAPTVGNGAQAVAEAETEAEAVAVPVPVEAEAEAGPSGEAAASWGHWREERVMTNLRLRPASMVTAAFPRAEEARPAAL